MKLAAPVNGNYAAVVVRIKTLTPLAGCDNLVGTPLLGFQAIVGKDSQVGDLGIVFPAETQLSAEYTKANNLYRHAEMNADPEKKGYLEDNRRVKAMKFRGHRSDCLFMPLTSLAYTGEPISSLSEGDIFDTLGKHAICSKYVVKVAGPARTKKDPVKVAFKRVDLKFLPEHYETDNYFRERESVGPEEHVVVTQKLHGTSIRIGHTIVRRELAWHERLAKRLGVRISETEYDYVFGSRKVIKDPGKQQNHWYGSDLWSAEGEKLRGLIPQGFIVYGELIGWVADAPIQKDYTYCLPQGSCQLYVYRVAYVNPQSKIVDLSWTQVKEFCLELGLKHVPELWQGLHSDLKVEQYLDRRFAETGYGSNQVRFDCQAVPLEPNKKLVDEGVCIRVDGMVPRILKAKSPVFLRHESDMLDQEVVDLETVGGDADGTAAA